MLSIKKISLFTIIKIIGAVLSISFYLLQVDYFGIERPIECYFVAISLVLFLQSLTQVGHLSTIFLPIYHSIKSENGFVAANSSFWVVTNWLVLFSLVIIFLSFFISTQLVYLMAPGFEVSARELVCKLFQVLSFTMILQLLNIKLKILLNALNIFNRTEVFSIIQTPIAISILVFYYNELGIWSLVVGLYIGQICTLILNLILLYSNGIKYQFVFSSDFFDSRSFFKNALHIYMFTFSRKLYEFILTASISFLPQGIYAIYKYVVGIYTRTGGIILAPTTNMFFTNFSLEKIANPNKAKKLLQKAFSINVSISLILVAVVTSFGQDIVQFLWYQKITGEYTKLALLILIVSFAALIFDSIGGLCFRMLFVMKQVKRLYIGWALTNLIAAFLAFFCIKMFAETGLIFLLLITGFLNNLLFFILVYKKDNTLFELIDIRFLLKLGLIFILSILIGQLINQIDISVNLVGRLSFLLTLSFKSLLLFISILVLTFVIKPSIKLWKRN